MLKIQIKNRWTGSILFEYEKDKNTIKETLVEAAKKGADLQGADLKGAYLQGAYLKGAYLKGAYLQGAYLQGAYLQDADLQGADLKGAYLQGAYLKGADLQGADLQGAYLQGADLQGEKISKAIVFTGLYKYIVIPYITEEGVKRVKMGCHNRTLEEWENDFWNNPNEFPNNDSVDSNLRLMAFNTAKEWFKIVTK